MFEPGKSYCDACGAEIKPGEHFTPLDVPLPKPLQAKLAEETEKIVQERFGGSPLGSLISVAGLVPRSWKVLFCVGCTSGILGPILPKVADMVRAAIQKRVEANRRGDESLAELEDAMGV